MLNYSSFAITQWIILKFQQIRPLQHYSRTTRHTEISFSISWLCNLTDSQLPNRAEEHTRVRRARVSCVIQRLLLSSYTA